MSRPTRSERRLELGLIIAKHVSGLSPGGESVSPPLIFPNYPIALSGTRSEELHHVVDSLSLSDK